MLETAEVLAVITDKTIVLTGEGPGCRSAALLSERRNSMRLKDKVAVITGGAQGIGAAYGAGFAKEGAKYLVTVSNDGWYGVSSAPHQHFMVLPFRAVENRVGVARAANSTLSGFVEPTGKIISTLGLFEQGKLSAGLKNSREGLTFYTTFGDVFSYLCGLVALFGVFTGLKGAEWQKKKS